MPARPPSPPPIRLPGPVSVFLPHVGRYAQEIADVFLGRSDPATPAIAALAEEVSIVLAGNQSPHIFVYLVANRINERNREAAVAGAIIGAVIAEDRENTLQFEFDSEDELLPEPLPSVAETVAGLTESSEDGYEPNDENIDPESEG